jgi:putative transposase
VGRAFRRDITSAVKRALAPEGLGMSRIARRVHQVGVYFVTTHTWQRRELFRQHGPAELVVHQLLDCRDRGFYELHAFVLMPDHLHVLLTPGDDTTLEKALQMIKGGSSHAIRTKLHFRWPVWQPGFHDRWLRDEAEYRARDGYIRQNPVKVQLAARAEEYPWSSANAQFAMDPSRFDRLQGLKPEEESRASVAAKAATHKPGQ